LWIDNTAVVALAAQRRAAERGWWFQFRADWLSSDRHLSGDETPDLQGRAETPFEQFRDTGVDGIFTDFPDVGACVIKGAGK
jgi:glycerophosphoryl diester phosphodiesterase